MPYLASGYWQENEVGKCHRQKKKQKKQKNTGRKEVEQLKLG